MDRPDRLAAALVDAARDRTPIPPLTDADPGMSALEAYRVQQLVVERRLPREGPIAGYKVGLTSKPMQDLLGIDTPDYGPILSSMLRSGDAILRRADFIQPRVEAEIAFVLAAPLRGPGLEAEDVLAATAGVMAAIEVIDSRILDWRIRLADTIADLASSAMIVTSGRSVPVAGLALEDIRVVMRDDGEEVSAGLGAAVLGHPARAAAWLANTLGELGVGLEAGHVVMPGAMHAAVTVQPGHRYRAEFDRLGAVEVAFEGGVAMSASVPCAVVGTGNIGTDLMAKLLRSPTLELRAMVGIDPASQGLAAARLKGIEVTSDGVDWLIDRAEDFAVVFEATSARIHAAHAPRYRQAGLRAIDLTPAGVGPAVVPGVNLDRHLQDHNLNLITCGGQATVPIVAAVRRVTAVPYAEIVSTVASRSAGPGTRQNIDEFTRRTSQALVDIGGAASGKAIIVLNPADPPILMRNTVYCALSGEADRAEVAASIEAMVAEVSAYVPGYRLKSAPVFDDGPFSTPGGESAGRVVALLEVEGAADFLPAYAGNLDIMTAAAVRVGEALAPRIIAEAGA